MSRPVKPGEDAGKVALFCSAPYAVLAARRITADGVRHFMHSSRELDAGMATPRTNNALDRGRPLLEIPPTLR